MNTSVLRDWVTGLGLREQSTMLTAIRGCDLTPKNPLDSIERTITAFIRYAVLVPFDEREVDLEPGCFMQTRLPEFKPSAIEHYPFHWVMHVLHTLEVIAYRCPEDDTREQALRAYKRMVSAMHLNVETLPEMEARLSEDRIGRGGSIVE